MRLARLRRADLGRRRVGPREERPAGDDEGRDEGERDDERHVGNVLVVEVLLNKIRPARAGDLPDVHGGLVRGHHRREGGLGKDPFVGWREAHLGNLCKPVFVTVMVMSVTVIGRTSVV